MTTEHDEARTIALSRGQVAIVDAADYDALSAYKWCVQRGSGGDWRAMRKAPRAGGAGDSILMHRAIAGAPSGMVVDHINHNSLDNRRANLRVCTHAENLRNRTGNKDSSSQYLGVSWHKARGKWTAQIEIEGRKKHLGYFVDEESAARQFYAEFANPNFKECAA